MDKPTQDALKELLNAAKDLNEAASSIVLIGGSLEQLAEVISTFAYRLEVVLERYAQTLPS